MMKFSYFDFAGLGMLNWKFFALTIITFNVFLFTLTAHAHEQPLGKPGSNVKMTHDYNGRSQMGESVFVTLQFAHSAEVVSMEVTLNAPPGLQIQEGPLDMQNLTLPVSITVLENGKHYLGVHLTTMEADGQQLKRVFEVPFLAGNNLSTQKVQKQHSERKGKKVVILESRETH